MACFSISAEFQVTSSVNIVPTCAHNGGERNARHSIYLQNQDQQWLLAYAGLLHLAPRLHLGILVVIIYSIDLAPLLTMPIYTMPLNAHSTRLVSSLEPWHRVQGLSLATSDLANLPRYVGESDGCPSCLHQVRCIAGI